MITICNIGGNQIVTRRKHKTIALAWVIVILVFFNRFKKGEKWPFITFYTNLCGHHHLVTFTRMKIVLVISWRHFKLCRTFVYYLLQYSRFDFAINIQNWMNQGDDKGTLPNKTIQKNEASDRNLSTCVKCSGKQRDLCIIRWNGKLKVSSIRPRLLL